MVFGLFGGASSSAKEPVQDGPNSKIQAKSAADLIQGSLVDSKRVKDDDYDFEDIEVIRQRHGVKHRTKRVTGHSWGEIAMGTATLCLTSGAFGSVMGLCVGAITGPIMAPAGHRIPVTIALMKRQAMWFGVIFGGGGGIAGAVRKYA